MTGWIILGVIVLLVIALVNWFVSTQRQLVNLDELCNNALSQIEVQLNSRWDALMQLAQQASNYSQHESQTLIETIRARRGSEIKTADDVNDQNSAFGSVLGRLMVVVEQYPELKASGLYEKVMEAVNNFENNVRNSRMIYNDTATKMNRYVRQWLAVMGETSRPSIMMEARHVASRMQRYYEDFYGRELSVEVFRDIEDLPPLVFQF